MTVGIVTGMEKLYAIMTRCLETENTTNGLLSQLMMKRLILSLLQSMLFIKTKEQVLT